MCMDLTWLYYSWDGITLKLVPYHYTHTDFTKASLATSLPRQCAEELAHIILQSLVSNTVYVIVRLVAVQTLAGFKVVNVTPGG